MTGLKVRSAITLIAVFVLAAHTAFASSTSNTDGSKPAPPPGATANILGQWAFTAQTPDYCTFSGSAFLSAGPVEGGDERAEETYGCELTARQSCSDGTWVVEQSCTASRLGDELIIISKVETFLQGDPDVVDYLPDNFRLNIVSGSLMVGSLVSWGVHEAEFRRPDGAIS